MSPHTVTKILLAMLCAANPPTRMPICPPASVHSQATGAPPPRRRLLAICCGWKLRGWTAGKAAVRFHGAARGEAVACAGPAANTTRRRAAKRGRTVVADPQPTLPLALPPFPSSTTATSEQHTQ